MPRIESVQQVDEATVEVTVSLSLPVTELTDTPPNGKQRKKPKAAMLNAMRQALRKAGGGQ